ncbi:hypothetical protein [Pelagibius sp. Alg239-R121]|uniref:hypothetical protein n=1 Tax=Pelagibius sp. Alg239-R121 TaxID=2993448 RepID=UPI0024A6243E|nr:hypothetical protein [Pelagibius sp. Alg239-R121]
MSGGLMVAAGQAFAEYDIGKSGGARGIGKMEDYLQDWINFATGPWGLVVIVGGLILGASMWALAPRGGGLGIALRAAAAGLLIVNLGTVVAGFTVT